MATTDIQHIVGSTAPARAAVRFIGGATDDAVAIDVFAAARVAANDSAGCFTAWVCLPDKTGDYGIVSCGDTAAIEYITLSVKAGKVRIQCFDATTEQFDHATTDVVITPHKWHHIAVVQNADTGATRPPKIYVDGVQKATTMTDETDNGTWFLDLDLTDDGSIGAAEEAGAPAQVKECKGAISDVKYFSIELTDAEVMADYHNGDATSGSVGATPAATTTRKATVTTAFTDHWDMKDDVTNLITAANFGVIEGDVMLCNAYSEFSSRIFSSVTPLISADNVNLSVSNETAHLLIVKSA